MVAFSRLNRARAIELILLRTLVVLKTYVRGTQPGLRRVEFVCYSGEVLSGELQYPAPLCPSL